MPSNIGFKIFCSNLYLNDEILNTVFMNVE